MVENIRADVVDFMGLKPKAISAEILLDLRWTLYTVGERVQCADKASTKFLRSTIAKHVSLNCPNLIGTTLQLSHLSGT